MKRLLPILLILFSFIVKGENYRKYTVISKVGNIIQEPKTFLIPTEMEEAVLKDSYILNSNFEVMTQKEHIFKKNKTYYYVFDFELSKINEKPYFVDLYVKFPLNSVESIKLYNNEFNENTLGSEIYLGYQIQPDKTLYISHEHFSSTKASIVIEFTANSDTF